MATLLATNIASAAPTGAIAEIDRSIARVGSAVIWESQIAARVKAGAARTDVIEDMINEELVLAEGKRVGLTVTRAEVLAAFEEIKQANALDDAGLDKALAEAGYTRPRYLLELERQLIRLRVRNQVVVAKVIVTDAAVDAAVKARPDASKETIKKELRDAETLKVETEWMASLRKRAFITRRP